MLPEIVLEGVDGQGRTRPHPAGLLLIEKAQEGPLERLETGDLRRVLLDRDGGLDDLLRAEEPLLRDVPVFDLEDAPAGQVEDRRGEDGRGHRPPLAHEGLDDGRRPLGREVADVVGKVVEPVVLAHGRPGPEEKRPATGAARRSARCPRSSGGAGACACSPPAFRGGPPRRPGPGGRARWCPRRSPSPPL